MGVEWGGEGRGEGVDKLRSHYQIDGLKIYTAFLCNIMECFSHKEEERSNV